MAEQERKKAPPTVLGSMLFFAIGWYLWTVFNGTDLEIIAWIGVFFAGLTALQGLGALSRRSHEIFTILKATRAQTGHAGTATWQTPRDTRRNGHRKPEGWFLGLKDGHAVFDAKSVHGVTYAPPGSGKTIGPVITGICLAAASGEYDMVIYSDPKPEIGPIVKPFIERRGGEFIAINPSGKFSDQMGQSASFNACELVKQASRNHPETLLADCRALNLQLVKAPKDGGTDKNGWWKEGARRLIGCVQANYALTDPERCCYPDIQRVVEDPELLDKTLDEIALREDLLEGDLAAMAKDLIKLSIDDQKNFGSMRSEASTSLQMFRPSGAVARVSREMSFDLSTASKRTPLVVGLTSDMTSIEEQLQLAGLNLLALIRMSVRRDRPLKIKIIWDEANFAPLENLVDLLTISRGLGCSFELFYQSAADARRVLGKDGFESLMANCDRKTWFGISDPNVAEEVYKGLGEIGALKESYRSQGDGVETSLAHERRRLATADELRRLKKGLMVSLIGNEKPMICEHVSYGAIAPLRSQLGKSPWHKSKLKKAIRVWMSL